MGRGLRIGAFLAGFSAFLLIGCASLPQPFAPEERTPEEEATLLPPHGQDMWVGDFRGLPPEQGMRVAGTLLATLHAEGIPASAANRNEASLVLDGSAKVTEANDEGMRFELRWTLSTAAGEAIGTVHETQTLPKELWKDDPRTLDRLAISAARKIARLARGDEPVGALSSAVAVWPIDGAPGDGKRSLTFAVRAALAEAGVPLSGGNREPGLILLGEVRLGEAKAGQQEARLSWSLIRPSGEAIGSFTQVNAIAEGQMEGAWETLAPSIAAGTAEGVVAVIKRMQREKPVKTQ